MKITVLTLFPKMIEGFFEESIVKRAQEKGVVEIEVVNFRNFATDSHKSVDDKPYGGGAGMVLRVDVLSRALKSVASGQKSEKMVLTSAKGEPFNQKKAQEFSKLDHLILVAGHYEAVDERIMTEVDEEISVGDFVMTGGEIAVSAVVDAVVRLLPGALKKEEATVIESFQIYPLSHLIEIIGENSTLKKIADRGVKEVRLLEYPHYTRPEVFEGQTIPKVLMNGNHADIEKWRLQKSFEETLKKRPDLLGI